MLAWLDFPALMLVLVCLGVGLLVGGVVGIYAVLAHAEGDHD